jgi:folate-binding protein YgfZ
LSPAKPVPRKLFLHEIHQKSGARFVPANGWLIPRHFGDYTSEIRAGFDNLALLDRSYLGQIMVSGRDRLDLLQRISTSDLIPAAPSAAGETLFITPKGRIIDRCRVINFGGELLLISSFYDPQPLINWISRFIIMEEVYLQNASAEFIWLTLWGPAAPDFINRLSHKTISGKDESLSFSLRGENVLACRDFQQASPAYDLLFKTENGSDVYLEIYHLLKTMQGRPIGERAYQVLRIQHGIPQAGIELTEEYNPLELRLHQSVSFNKGCYTGQEVMTRLDHYDKVQKYLMCLELDKKIVTPPPLPIYAARETIGWLTSFSYNPYSKKYIGLGLVRKRYARQDHSGVEIRSGRSSITARLKLPPLTG